MKVGNQILQNGLRADKMWQRYGHVERMKEQRWLMQLIHWLLTEKNVDEGMRKGIYEGIRKFNCKINYRAVMLTESEGPLVQCLEKVIFTRGK